MDFRKVIMQRVKKSPRLNRLVHFGTKRICPCCRSSLRKFSPFGKIPRKEALCPICQSLERHRLVWLYLQKKTDFFDGRSKKILHIAPEAQLSSLFKAIENLEYVSGDLNRKRAGIVMDITDIPFPDETFDVVLCSHVLEHVPEDRKAMQEIHRVLTPRGWAILQVPISSKSKTEEDLSITCPKERERLYGQWNHVRRYGLDYKDRLSEAGFKVKVDGFAKEMPESAAERFGIRRGEHIYFCSK